MNTLEYITQGLSIAGLICIVASYLQKKKTTLILCQLIGGAIFAVHYLLGQNYAGFLLNIIAVIRALVFFKGNFSKKAGTAWVWVFHGLCVGAYAATFLIFGTDPTLPNLLRSALPMIGMFALSISFNMSGAKEIRRLGIVSSVCWLIYNSTITPPSIGGIICECICLVSIVVGMIRYDIKKK